MLRNYCKIMYYCYGMFVATDDEVTDTCYCGTEVVSHFE